MQAAPCLCYIVGADLCKPEVDILDIQDPACNADIGTRQICSQMASEKLLNKLTRIILGPASLTNFQITMM